MTLRGPVTLTVPVINCRQERAPLVSLAAQTDWLLPHLVQGSLRIAPSRSNR